MKFDQKALRIEILGFKGEIGLIEEIWASLSKADLHLGHCLWNMMNFSDFKQILTSLGEISEWFGEKEEGEVSHASLELLQGNLPLYLWSEVN